MSYTNANANKKQLYENIYKNLKEYMFYPEVIKNNMAFVFEEQTIRSVKDDARHIKNATHKKEVEKEEKEEETPFFIPQERDKLFWCFYIFIHGEYEYKIAKNNSNTFSIEKKWKLDTLAKVKEQHVIDFLKSIKVKSAEIEDELMNKEKLSLKGLQVFSFIYKLSIMYISGRKYCEFLYNNNQPATIPFVIVNTENKQDSILRKPDEKYVNNIRDTYWKMDNVNKPLKSASSYSLSELQEICNKMGISLENNETKKKKTIKVLYQELLSHFV